MLNWNPFEKSDIERDRYFCKECEQPDVFYEGMLDDKPVFVCYNCGHAPTETEAIENTSFEDAESLKKRLDYLKEKEALEYQQQCPATSTEAEALLETWLLVADKNARIPF